jgi:hypothetical protein
MRPARLAPVTEWDPAAPALMLPSVAPEAISFPLTLALTALADRMADPAWEMGRQIRQRLETEKA